jgi:putative ABC transport system permease protein
MYFRQSVRALNREPGFALFAIFTLALGIGASTAMFSVFNGVLLAPVPYADPQRVVAINTRFTDTGRLGTRTTGGDWVDLAAAHEIFDQVARYAGGEIGVQLRNRAEWANVYLVSPNFFEVFRVAPVMGRLLTTTDAQRSVVVSPGFAQRAFGSVNAAVGQVLRVDSRSYEVAGVTPGDFQFPDKAEMWMADSVLPQNRNRTAYNYKAIARLKEGLSPAAAAPRLDALSAQLAAAYPENRTKRFAVVPIEDTMVRTIRPTVVLLMAAVLLVLLISCTNVAHLLLARAASRAREFAVRAALGAGRARIIGQVLTESLLIGLAGGLAGMMTAYAGVRAVLWLAPEDLPRLGNVTVDWRVLGFGIGMALVSSLLFGLAPAWQASRNDVQDGLKSASSRGVLGSRSVRLRNVLVACEIALSFTLALGAGLLVRSFVALNSVSLGFRTEGILVAYAHAPADTLEKALAATRLFEHALDELGHMPGVKSAAGAMGLPAGSYGSNGKYAVDGADMQHADMGRMPDAGFRLASEHYFATLGIPLLAGREFNQRDLYDAPFVAIVSQALARKSFPNQNAIGRKILCGLDSDKWMTIVGVVGDVRSDGPGQAPGPELYMPFQQHPWHANELQLAVRTAGPPEAMADAVVRKIRALDPEIAVKTTTMQTMVSDSIATPRFRTFLVTVFAAVALLLAMAGVYGVTAYLVAQRTSELGLRMALGSAPAGIVRLILSHAGRLAASGLLLGVALSLAGSRLLQNLLFGVQGTDLFGYASAAAAIGVITVAAAAVPAWRAARIDPAIALREE